MFGSKEKNARLDAFADQLIAELIQRFPVEKEAELRTLRGIVRGEKAEAA